MLRLGIKSGDPGWVHLYCTKNDPSGGSPTRDAATAEMEMYILAMEGHSAGRHRRIPTVYRTLCNYCSDHQASTNPPGH